MQMKVAQNAIDYRWLSRFRRFFVLTAKPSSPYI